MVLHGSVSKGSSTVLNLFTLFYLPFGCSHVADVADTNRVEALMPNGKRVAFTLRTGKVSELLTMVKDSSRKEVDFCFFFTVSDLNRCRWEKCW